MRILRAEACAQRELKAVCCSLPVGPSATLWNQEGQIPPFLSRVAIRSVCSRINSHSPSQCSCKFQFAKVLQKTQHLKGNSTLSRGSS